MKRVLYGTIIILLTGAGVNAQIAWTGLNGPYGGRVNDITRHSSGAMVIATETAGVLRSTDAGVTWSKVTTGSVVKITDLDQDASGNIYAVSNISSFIFKSTDAGATFNQITSNNAFTLYKIEAVTATLIYIANFNTVYKSVDSGATFTSFGSTSQITDLDYYDPAPSPGLTKLYVSTIGAGVRISTNSGALTSGTGLTSSLVYSLSVNTAGVAFALASDGPFKSTDGGSTWSSIKAAIPDVSFIGILGLDASDNLYLANGHSTSYKIYTSTTSGAAWSAGTTIPKEKDLGIANPSSGLFLSSTNWFLTFLSGGVYVTGNAGTAWTQSNTGFKALTPTQIFALSSTPSTLYMTDGSTFGYYQSNDDGTTWNVNVNGAAGNGIINSFASPASGVILASTSPGVIRSADQGVTWNLVSATILGSLVSGTNVTYSISGTTLYTSVDQGANWTSLALTGFGGTVTGNLFLDAAGSLYCRTTGNTLYKINVSTGAATALAVTAIDFSVVGNSVYALTNSTTLNVSIDNGTSWLAQGILSAFAANKIWAFPNNVVLTQSTNSSNVNYSIDNGGTWIASPLLDAAGRAMSMIATTTGVVYVATSNSVVHKSPATVIPPVAPTALNFIGNISTLVDLFWTDNANNESSFLVQVSIGNNTTYQTGGTAGFSGTNRQHLVVVGASPNTLYFYRVAAVNAAGQSAFSNEISLTTPSTCATAIPNNRSWTATAVADGGFTGRPPGPWTNAAVQILLTGGNRYSVSAYSNLIVPTNVHSEPSVGFFYENCGQTYFSQSIDIANGNGSWNGTNTLVLKWQAYPFTAIEFKATTTYVLNPTDPIPATPTLNLGIYSSTSVFLFWNLTAFETQYKIYRSTTSGSGFVAVATVNYPTTFYIDKNLTSGTTYYYKITALNATGESAQSPQLAVTPSATTLFSPTENDISLNYENQQGASWGDFDNDGDEDIVTPSFTNRAGISVPPVFFENLGSNQFARRDLTVLVHCRKNNCTYQANFVALFYDKTKQRVFIRCRTKGGAVTIGEKPDDIEKGQPTCTDYFALWGRIKQIGNQQEGSIA